MSKTNLTSAQQGETLKDIVLSICVVIGVLGMVIVLFPILLALTVKVAEIVFMWMGI